MTDGINCDLYRILTDGINCEIRTTHLNTTMILPFLRRKYRESVRWIDAQYDSSPRRAIQIECVGGLIGALVIGAIVVLIIVVTNL